MGAIKQQNCKIVKLLITVIEKVFLEVLTKTTTYCASLTLLCWRSSNRNVKTKLLIGVIEKLFFEILKKNYELFRITNERNIRLTLILLDQSKWLVLQVQFKIPTACNIFFL